MDIAVSIAPRITPTQAKEMVSNGNALIVDLRDTSEIKDGEISGAIHVSRGMLEFRANPNMPYHDRNFSKDRTIIICCPSESGTALSAKLLQSLGYRNVFSLGELENYEVFSDRER